MKQAGWIVISVFIGIDVLISAAYLLSEITALYLLLPLLLVWTSRVIKITVSFRKKKTQGLMLAFFPHIELLLLGVMVFISVVQRV